MIKTFKPKMNILPAAQKKIWPELRAVGNLGFVLYGGTAIALRLGHRTSIDFDFFSEQTLDKARVLKIPVLKNGTVVQDSVETMTLLVRAADQAPVKISFFGSIDFGRIGEPEQTEDGILQVASLRDLLALKLKVILQRVESKDYQDIAALLNSGLTLDGGLAAARALYRSMFQPAESLKALVYFEGGDLAALPIDTRKTLMDAAKHVQKLPDVKVISQVLCQKNP